MTQSAATARPSTSPTSTQLRGTWLVAARVGWLLVALLCLGLFIATLPRRVGGLSVICTPPNCVQLQTTSEGAAALQSLGISLPTYAYLIAGVDILFALMFAGAGAIIFWRRSDDRMAMILSM